MGFAGAMAVAMLLDAICGWPDWLYARVGHPVTWIGKLIKLLDVAWNRSLDRPATRRVAGTAAATIVIALCAFVGWLVQSALPTDWTGMCLVGVLAWPLVAMRSLKDHVEAVAKPMEANDVDGARAAVSLIVGRDPRSLDQSAIVRAAIESLAENTSDGVLAPLFFGALFGLPGIFGYKAVNTLDSMIGHRSERHLWFGWAAARIDDVANSVPARLTGIIFALVSPAPVQALSCMWRDASRHRSINAGWPEAAMAGALGVRLSGPRSYEGHVTDEPWLNQGASDPTAGDIRRGLHLYVRAMMLVALLLLALTFV